jgi:hypothetical protein
MAKTTLKPKCTLLMEQLIARAEQQLKAAFPLLQQQGCTHTYSVKAVEYVNGSPKYSTVDFPNCIGSYCCTFRLDDNGDVLVHVSGTNWIPLYSLSTYKDLSDLAQAADFLLKQTQGNAL